MLDQIAENLQPFERSIVANLEYVQRVAFFFTRNHHDANDIAQETALRALGTKDRLRDEARLKTWLYEICRNTFISSYRKTKREGVGESEASEMTEQPRLFLSEGWDYAYSRNPEHYLNQNLDLRMAMEKVPVTARKTFVLRHIDGFEVKEMHSMEGVSTHTIYSRLDDAAKYMKEALDDKTIEVPKKKRKMNARHWRQLDSEYVGRIVSAYTDCEGDVKSTARYLGLSENTVKKYWRQNGLKEVPRPIQNQHSYKEEKISAVS